MYPHPCADRLSNEQAIAVNIANLHSAYEAGFSGFVLHRVLKRAGIENLLVNAGSIKTTVQTLVKTDKRDALKLASLLEAGRLKGIRVPSGKEEAQRLLTRTQQQLIEEQTAVKNKLRMKCHQMGLIAADEQRQMRQHSHYCDLRHLKVLSWMVSALVCSGQVEPLCWGTLCFLSCSKSPKH
jgi:transposase